MRTANEWKREFNLYYDNIASHKAPGLEDYEISWFLTRAQEAVVIALHNGSLGKPFESTEEITAYLSPLVSQGSGKKLDPSEYPTGIELSNNTYPNSCIFSLPSDILFITLEQCKLNGVTGCGDGVNAIVVPVTQDELWRTSRNPFKGPDSRRVLRLSYAREVEESVEGSDEYEGFTQRYSEIISKYPVQSYTVRYIRRPKPIILYEMAEDGYTINGQSSISICELDEALHQTILTEAVKLAKSTWQM